MAKKVASAAAGPDGDTKSQRTRARILDAAAHVLSVKGFAGTRLTDVADYAEIQAPAIYYYFPSREDLIEEVMFCGISDMRAHLRTTLDAMPADSTAMDMIMTAVEAHLRHELELSDYTTASIRNSGQIPEHLRTRQKKEEAAYGRIWQGLFANALADGDIRSDLDPRMARLLVMGALNWAAEWWDPRRGSVDAVVSNAQILVRSGLSPLPAATPKKRAARRPTTS
ncbi:TetR/AcrR family transcriptional regulator [Mycobacterium sp. SMC-8]|uniref:TetR/AcrR family transcriptional regulator n=1 Tax=Mycobacterium sp. SMC-8 TaxID=2857060 RepID=UPI0021B1F1D0|nr:TetR/AcrR family transcriptional regulator [Mycobacterium sp. SMC-8]UXA11523.1 TetR/AcrR family transcriptional regulator [Mycobacterium sp. SMC-8]